MHLADDTRNIQIELIKSAIDKKIEKSETQTIEEGRTLLVVYYADRKACYLDSDHFTLNEINILSQYCKSNADKLKLSKFKRIVIVNQSYMLYKIKPQPIQLWAAPVK